MNSNFYDILELENASKLKKDVACFETFVYSVNQPPPFPLFISHPKPRTFKRKFKAWQLAKIKDGNNGDAVVHF